MISLGRLLLAIQFLTCLSLTPTSPAKVTFFHGSPCLSDPAGRVPRRKCQSSKSPKLNPLGGSSTSGEGMRGPFPKISIERKTASGILVSFASTWRSQSQPPPRPYHEETVNDHTTSRPSIGRHARSRQLFWSHEVVRAVSDDFDRRSIWSQLRIPRSNSNVAAPAVS
jgi:hypothetical protein